MNRGTALALAAIMVLGCGIRLLPLRFGAVVGEIDPYLWRRMADALNAGGWDKWGSYVDELRWGGGFDVSYRMRPAMPYTAAALSLLLGGSLNAVLYGPLIFTALTILGVYLLASRFTGETGSLAAAWLYAFNSAVVGRTVAGWFDTESPGLFALVWVTLLALVALDNYHGHWERWLSVPAAGALLAYGASAWSGAWIALIPAGAAASAFMLRHRRLYPLVLVGVAVVAAVAWIVGLDQVVAKAAFALNLGDPALRVGENQAGSLLMLGVLHNVSLPLAAVALPKIIRNREDGATLLVFLAAGLFLGLSMQRLSVVAAVPLSLAAGVGVQVMLSWFKTDKARTVGYMALGVLLIVAAVPAFAVANQRQLVAQRDGGGWPGALEWLGEHAKGKMVAAWWDYGYWVQSAGCATIADGQTCIIGNIRDLAALYVGGELSARTIASKYSVKYIVVTDRLTQIRGSLEELCGFTARDSLLDAVPAWIRLEYENAGVKIYRVT